MPHRGLVLTERLLTLSLQCPILSCHPTTRHSHLAPFSLPCEARPTKCFWQPGASERLMNKPVIEPVLESLPSLFIS